MTIAKTIKQKENDTVTIFYEITLIGQMHLATGKEYIYQDGGIYKTRQAAWNYLKSEFGDDVYKEQGNRWEVAEIDPANLSDDEYAFRVIDD